MALLRIERGEALCSEVPLTRRTLRIGRDRENDICLDDQTKSVSRWHAELQPSAGGYLLVDLNSQNGVWQAGRRHARLLLMGGQPVAVGPYTLTLVDDHSLGSTAVAPRSAEFQATPPPRADAAPPARRSSMTLIGGAVSVMLFLIIVVAGVSSRRSASDEMSQASTSSEDDVATKLATASAMMDRSDYDAAQKVLDQVLRTRPDDMNAVALRARLTHLQTSGGRGTPASSSPATVPAPPAVVSPAPAPAPVAAPIPIPASRVQKSLPSVRPLPVDHPPAKQPAQTAAGMACRDGEAAAACTARTREVAARYDAAVAALKKGAFEPALQQLLEIDRDQPNYRDVKALTGAARAGLHLAVERALEVGARAESAGDLLSAEREYERASQLDVPTAKSAAGALARLRARRERDGADAFVRGKQYDAMGRRDAAIELYDRAVQWLPDTDPRKQEARSRLEDLRRRDSRGRVSLVLYSSLANDDAARQRSAPGYATFQDPDATFALEYPSSWQTTTGRGDLVVTFTAPRREAVVTIERLRMSIPLTPGDITEAFADIERDLLKERQPGVSDVRARLEDRRGQPMVIADYSRSGVRGQERVRQYSLPAGQTVFRLVCVSSDPQFEQYASAFARVADTFTAVPRRAIGIGRTAARLITRVLSRILSTTVA